MLRIFKAILMTFQPQHFTPVPVIKVQYPQNKIDEFHELKNQAAAVRENIRAFNREAMKLIKLAQDEEPKNGSVLD